MCTQKDSYRRLHRAVAAASHFPSHKGTMHNNTGLHFSLSPCKQDNSASPHPVCSALTFNPSASRLRNHFRPRALRGGTKFRSSRFSAGEVGGIGVAAVPPPLRTFCWRARCLINAPLSWRSSEEGEREDCWERGVVCIDLVVPFEGTAVSEFRVNTHTHTQTREHTHTQARRAGLMALTKLLW